MLCEEKWCLFTRDEENMSIKGKEKTDLGRKAEYSKINRALTKGGAGRWAIVGRAGSCTGNFVL